MPPLTEIHAANARFRSENHTNLVCVFAGATSGIGLSTLQQLATLLSSSTFYILGRDPARFVDKLSQLELNSPSNKFILSRRRFP
jgi:hypothetical protein